MFSSYKQVKLALVAWTVLLAVPAFGQIVIDPGPVEDPVTKEDVSLQKDNYETGRYEAAAIDIPQDKITTVKFDVSMHTDPKVCYRFTVLVSDDGTNWTNAHVSTRCGKSPVQRDGKPITYALFGLGDKAAGKKVKTVLELIAEGKSLETEAKIETTDNVKKEEEGK